MRTRVHACMLRTCPACHFTCAARTWPALTDNVQALRQHASAQGERGPQTFDLRLRGAPSILTPEEEQQHAG